MDRIMALREQALEAGLKDSNGARHTEVFEEMVSHSGRLDELRLPMKSVGMTNLPAMMSFAPVGIAALLHGKLPPIIHKNVEDVNQVRRVARKIQEAKSGESHQSHY